MFFKRQWRRRVGTAPRASPSRRSGRERAYPVDLDVAVAALGAPPLRLLAEVEGHRRGPVERLGLSARGTVHVLFERHARGSVRRGFEATDPPVGGVGL